MNQTTLLVVLVLSTGAVLGLLGGLVAGWHLFGGPTWAAAASISSVAAVPFAAGAVYFWFRAHQCANCTAGSDETRHDALLAYVANFGLLLLVFVVFQALGTAVGRITRQRAAPE